MSDQVIQVTLPPGMTEKQLLKVIERYNKSSKNKGKGRNAFQCFICLEYFPESKLGGELSHKKVCTDCLRTADEGYVGYLINFDRNHGFNA